MAARFSSSHSWRRSVPWVAVAFALFGQCLESQIEAALVPHGCTVDPLRPGHTAVFHHLVELSGADPDVDGRLDAAQATARLGHAPQFAAGGGHWPPSGPNTRSVSGYSPVEV